MAEDQSDYLKSNFPLLRKLYSDKQNSIKELLHTFSISKSTLYRVIKLSPST